MARILLITYKYLNLYTYIEKELKRQGHEVHTILEPVFKRDPHNKNGKFKQLKLFLEENITKHKHSFWKNKIKSDLELTKNFDYLICIQGTSIEKNIIDHLKTINPLIKTRLIIWDSNLYYDYFRNIPLFDKSFTFDDNDYKDYRDIINYLPFFWIETPSNEKIVYDFCCIGTNHDNRYRILKQIKEQIKNQHSYFFKLYIPDSKKTFLDLLRICFFRDKYPDLINKYELINSTEDNEMKLYSIIPVEEVNSIIQRSKCVIDTDREIQGGITPRLLWALVNGKKIFTTNKNIVNSEFYISENIEIIDREKPVIPNSDNKGLDADLIKERFIKYRIDNWIRTILSK